MRSRQRRWIWGIFLQKRGRRGAVPLSAHIVDLRKSFLDRYRLPAAVLLVAALGLVGILSWQFVLHAEVKDFYAGTCLGEWKNPQHAEGEPENFRLPSPLFNEENSSVFVFTGGAARIFCGNFIPEEYQPEGKVTHAALTLVWDIPALHSVEKEALEGASANQQEDAQGNSPQAKEPQETGAQNVPSENGSQESQDSSLPPEAESSSSASSSVDTAPAPSDSSSPASSTEEATPPAPSSTPPVQEPAPASGTTSWWWGIIAPVFAEDTSTTPPSDSIDPPASTTEATASSSSSSTTDAAPSPPAEGDEKSSSSTASSTADTASAPSDSSSLASSAEATTTASSTPPEDAVPATTTASSSPPAEELAPPPSETNQGGAPEVPDGNKKQEDATVMPHDEDAGQLLEVSYSFDGQAWNTLAAVDKENWQHFTVTLPMHSWDDLRKLQIAIGGASSSAAAVPEVLLDGMLVEVQYETAAVLAEKAVSEQNTALQEPQLPQETPLIVIPDEEGPVPVNKSDTMFRADEVPEFEFDLDQLPAPDQSLQKLPNVALLPQPRVSWGEALLTHAGFFFKKLFALSIPFRAQGAVAVPPHNLFLKNPIVARIYDPDGKQTAILPRILVVNNKLRITIPDPGREFRPGKYEMKLWIERYGAVYFSKRDFYWGVLAVNFNKSVYPVRQVPMLDEFGNKVLGWEQAVIGATVLDNQGRGVCDAKVVTTVVKPDGRKVRFTTDDNSMRRSARCGPDSVTDEPDYRALLAVDTPGRYRVQVVATTRDGVRRVEDEFFAERDPVFEVERSGPIRLYPPAEYTMRLIVRARRSFQGEVVEKLPASFQVRSRFGEVATESGVTYIRWRLALLGGEATTLTYRFTIPDKSPELYRAGPLELLEGGKSVWREARSWQFAADSAGDIILLWDGATIPDGWTCISCSPGDPFYGVFPRGAASYGTATGGSDTHTHTATFVSMTDGSESPANATPVNGGSTESAAHVHPVANISVSSEDLKPPFRQLKLIRANTSTLPAGVIGMFDTNSSALPNGWSYYSAMAGYYLRGGGTITTGGSSSHTHTLTATLNATSSILKPFMSGVSIAATGHTHSLSGTINSASNNPPYIEVVFAKLSTATSVPHGLIAMFDATPPTGWESVSGSGQSFNGRFVKGSATYGATGGSSTHTHSDSTITSGTPSGTTQTTSGVAPDNVWAGPSHTHDVTFSFSSESSLPAYRDVIFARAIVTKKFISQIKQSGGDYSSLSSWEAAMTNGGLDLTATSTLVFSHGGVTGSISDGATVTGATSGATGTAVHVTASQILIKNISGVFQPGEQVYATKNVDYVVISDSGYSAIPTAEITGTWTSPDTSYVLIDGFTTDALRYVYIYTTSTARHSGTWSTTAYRYERTNGSGLDVRDNHVRIDGLQIHLTISNGVSRNAMNFSVLSAGAEEYLSNTIIRGDLTDSANHNAIRVSDSDGTYYFWNNLIYGFTNGGSTYGIVTVASRATGAYYNNTVVHSKNCLYGRTGIKVKNTLTNSCTDGFSGSWNSASDYNLSDIAGDAPGSNSKNGTTVTFVDDAGNDFHLDPSDTGAKDSGTDLSSDADLAFSTDFDGDSRPQGSQWDIGADEAAGAANQAPSVANVVLNGGNAITLTANATTSVTAVASTTDPDGAGDILYATSTIYRSGVGSDCTASDLNCYHVASSSCTFTDATSTVQCTAEIWYFAQATDASSSFPAEDWQAVITVVDSAGNSDSSSTASGVELNTLLAIHVPSSTIDYGTVAPNTDTGAVNQEVPVWNVGNASTSLKLSGTAMSSGSHTIATSSQHYATTTFTYGGNEQVLTDVPTLVPGFSLPAPTSTATVEGSTFWGIGVPGGTAKGTYTGVNTFEAKFEP